MDAELLNAVEGYKKQTADIEEQYSQKLVKVLLPKLTADFEPLFAQRQQFLDSQEGFWTNALLAPESPTSVLCADVDQKVLRALISVKVTKKIEGEDNIIRTVTFVFRPSIFLEGGELSRTMNSDGETKAASDLKWKLPEQARKGSILNVFDPKTPDQDAKAIMDAIDLLYQNPKTLLEN